MYWLYRFTCEIRSKNISMQLLLYLYCIFSYLYSIIFYWCELYCNFLQGYLKPRINELPLKKQELPYCRIFGCQIFQENN